MSDSGFSIAEAAALEAFDRGWGPVGAQLVYREQLGQFLSPAEVAMLSAYRDGRPEAAMLAARAVEHGLSAEQRAMLAASERGWGALGMQLAAISHRAELAPWHERALEALEAGKGRIEAAKLFLAATGKASHQDVLANWNRLGSWAAELLSRKASSGLLARPEAAAAHLLERGSPAGEAFMAYLEERVKLADWTPGERRLLAELQEAPADKRDTLVPEADPVFVLYC